MAQQIEWNHHIRYQGTTYSPGQTATVSDAESARLVDSGFARITPTPNPPEVDVVRFYWRGDWSALTSYLAGDVVRYGAMTWIATNNTTAGAVPSLVSLFWGQYADALGDAEFATTIADRDSETRATLDTEYGTLIGRAVDDTATAYALGVGALASWTSGLLVSVPPGTRPISVRYGIYTVVTTGGSGWIAVGVSETTTGALVDRGTAGPGSGAFSNATWASIQYVTGEVPFDPSATWRHFRIVAGVLRDGGSSLAASVISSAQAGSGSRRSWMEVNAR